MTNFSTYLDDKILDHILGTAAYAEPTVYAALFTTAPTMPGGTGGTEVSGGSYARVQVSGKFAAASAGSAASNAAITWPAATANWGTINGIGLYDAATGGNLLSAGSLTASKAVPSGDTFSITAGDLVEALQ